MVRKCTRFCTPRVASAVVFLVSVVSFIILSFNFLALGPGVPGQEINGKASVTPYTSRVVPISSGLFCESFKISKETWDNSIATWAWDSSVYILSKEPSSYKEFSFDIANNNITLGGGGEMWYMRQLHLLGNSTFAVHSCVIQKVSDDVQMCVVKGDQQYSESLSSFQRSHSYSCNGQYSLPSCTDNRHTPVPYMVTEDDTYYFVHFTNSTKVQNVRVNISITSVYYSTESTPLRNCTISQSELQCSADNIPLLFKGVALITTQVALNQSVQWSWEDTIQISWSCEGSFSGFVLVFFLPVIIGGVFFAIMLRVLMHCCKKQCTRPRTLNVKTQWTLMKIIALVLAIVGGQTITVLVCFLPLSYSPLTNRVLSSGETSVFPIKRFQCSSYHIHTNGSCHLSASLYISNITGISPVLDQMSR